jgi:hypothetical protein
MPRRSKGRHVIADIRYAPRGTVGPSWLICTDGTRLDAPTPELLRTAWIAHGGLGHNGSYGPAKYETFVHRDAAHA